MKYETFSGVLSNTCGFATSVLAPPPQPPVPYAVNKVWSCAYSVIS